MSQSGLDRLDDHGSHASTAIDRYNILTRRRTAWGRSTPVLRSPRRHRMSILSISRCRGVMPATACVVFLISCHARLQHFCSSHRMLHCPPLDTSISTWSRAPIMIFSALPAPSAHRRSRIPRRRRPIRASRMSNCG
ncbi:hypothetical protein OH77DRAFT_826259 [Trametes cingulata]|nr:hypothetical protein OH77DRAFT_826259 [Trametes cingulata]